MKEFSVRNLKYMWKFAETYPDESIVQEVLAQITWYHNLALMEKVKTLNERLWYIEQTIEQGWNRNVLVHQIESGLYHRQSKAITNFERTLPQPQSDLAQQILKDPYNFDFLSLEREARERDLERSLLQHLREFLLELGVGFAFVGSQYHLEVGGEDFYLDLLFYHLRLRCFVIIDLKMGAFKPEYSGKINFYVAAADDLLRYEDDRPTIGIILCKSRNQTIVEYSLRDMQQAIGVSTYRMQEELPKGLQENLPSVEILEAELNAIAWPNEAENY